MKKWLIVLIMGCALVGIAAKGCPFKGEDGDDGASGSSGQDAVIATYSYIMSATGAGNPALANTPTVVLADVESGKQTVTAYMEVIGEWIELPLSSTFGADVTDHLTSLGDGFVRFESYFNGVLIVGDACNGYDVMVIVKVFNK